MCSSSAKSLQLSGKAHQKLRPVIPQPLVNPPFKPLRYPNPSVCPYPCISRPDTCSISLTMPSLPTCLCIPCHSATRLATPYYIIIIIIITTTYLSAKCLSDLSPIHPSSGPLHPNALILPYTYIASMIRRLVRQTVGNSRSHDITLAHLACQSFSGLAGFSLGLDVIVVLLRLLGKSVFQYFSFEMMVLSILPSQQLCTLPTTHARLIHLSSLYILHHTFTSVLCIPTTITCFLPHPDHP